MEQDERKQIKTYEIGTVLDSLSVEELEETIALLETEITRLRSAMAAKGDSRKAAEAAFKF